MNLYGYMGLIIVLAAAIGWGTYERGSVEKWEGKYNTLVANYNAASAKAESDARALQIQRDAEIRDEGFRAATAQQIRADQLQTQLTSYRSTIEKLSQEKDLAHQCAAVSVAPDILGLLNGSGN